MSTTRQTTFATKEAKVRGVLRRASRHDTGLTVLTVSGGTDSTLAAWLTALYGPEYGIEPDAILLANTGTTLPQTALTAQILAALMDVPYIGSS